MRGYIECIFTYYGKEIDAQMHNQKEHQEKCRERHREFSANRSASKIAHLIYLLRLPKVHRSPDYLEFTFRAIII